MINVKAVQSAYKELIILECNGDVSEFAAAVQNVISESGGCRLDIIRPKRSLNANAYLWVLCDKIAEKLKTTKEDIYKKAVKDVGSFEILPVKETAVDDFIRHWNGRGIGWICEKIGESKLRGYVNIIAYFGSSVYDSKEMSRLIDYIVDEAEEIGVSVISKAELNSLIKEWGA